MINDTAFDSGTLLLRAFNVSSIGAGPLRRDVSEASWTGMFIIELTYKADLAEIDAHMAAHVKFLKKDYAAGNFLGRCKIPREGGIILVVAENRRQIEAIVQEDPFYAHGLADFRIIEFRASQRADDIQPADGSARLNRNVGQLKNFS